MFVGFYVKGNKKVITEKYKGKRVYVKLKGNREYVGRIQSIDCVNHENYVCMIDNKNRSVTFPEKEIKLIQEDK